MNKDEKTLKKEQKKIENQNKIHPLRYKKAGVLLTRAEVARIKEKKKKLKAEMKAAGITDRADKRILESASGAYFDKRKGWKAIAWIIQGRVLVALLLTLVVALSSMFVVSEITKMKGHFTVNITPELFKEGFSLGDSLSEDGKINNHTSNLRGDTPENAPCASITEIAKNVDQIDGEHNGGNYFAYTFYIENRNDEPASYAYELRINSQSQDAAKVAWAMLFIDGKAAFYAKATDDGDNQTLPDRDDNTRGYTEPPFIDVAAYPNEQYELIKSMPSGLSYYRLIAIPFESDDVITSGVHTAMESGGIHKYTVVVWIEGDDPDCTNDMIGGHFGVEFNFISLQE